MIRSGKPRLLGVENQIPHRSDRIEVLENTVEVASVAQIAQTYRQSHVDSFIPGLFTGAVSVAIGGGKVRRLRSKLGQEVVESVPVGVLVCN